MEPYGWHVSYLYYTNDSKICSNIRYWLEIILQINYFSTEQSDHFGCTRFHNLCTAEPWPRPLNWIHDLHVYCLRRITRKYIRINWKNHVETTLKYSNTWYWVGLQMPTYIPQNWLICPSVSTLQSSFWTLKTNYVKKNIITELKLPIDIG